MKKIILECIFILSTTLLFAQTVTVKDKDTGRPLTYATISSLSPAVSTTTDALGRADISEFQNASAIEIRMLGYQTLTLSFKDIQKAGFEIFLSPTSMTLDGIVVSATRWELNKRELPSKISTITPRDVILLNPQTAADMLGNSGEVFIQKSQLAGGSPMIRGFATNRLLYTVDGIRMNTAIFRSGNIQNVISLDPFAIEHSEVLFGPGSNIYGSDAIGGVMTFRTITPPIASKGQNITSGKAVMRISSANHELTGHFDASVGWHRWGITTSFTRFNFGDLLMGSKGPAEYLRPFYVERIDSIDRVFTNPNPRLQTPSEYNQTNLMQKVRFKPGEKWDFTYGFHYSETSEYSRYDRLIETASNGLPVFAVWKYGPQKWMMNMLEIQHNNQWYIYDRINLRVGYQNFEESRIDRRFNASRLRTQLEKVDALSANLDFYKSTTGGKYFYGIEYVLNKVKSNATAVNIKTGADVKVPDRYPQADWESFGAYLNYQRRLSEPLLIQLGARYSRYLLDADFSRLLEFYPVNYQTVNVDKGSVTGNAGIVYTPNEKWLVSINGATGFRAPNVDDMGKMFEFQSGEVIVPNPDLKAEYAYHGELNLARIFGNFLKVDVSAFYTYLDNAMVRRPFTFNGQDSILYNGQMAKVYALQNASYGTVWGFNAGAEIQLPEGFSITAKYNFQRGEEEMDDGSTSRSRHAAPPFGVARLNYRNEKLHLQFYGIFSGEVSYENLNAEEKQKKFIYARDKDGNPYSPSWYTLNFKATYKVNESLMISSGVENITDERYRPYSSGIVAPGRNFVLSLLFSF